MSYWSLASWFPDCVPCAPKLILTGSPIRADKILRLLECTSRHPVLLAGLGSALQGVSLDELAPTLLVSETLPGKGLLRMLTAPPSSGYLVSTGRNVHRADIWTAAYVGHGLTFSCAPASLHLHLERVQESAQTELSDVTPEVLQNELLSFRIFNRMKVAETSLKVGHLSPELDPVAQALGACVLQNVELQAEIIKVLEGIDAKARKKRESELPSILSEVLLKLCHQRAGTKVFVAQVATVLNEELRRREEVFTVSAEQVGHRLKKIGVATRRLGADGNGLLLDHETQRLIHSFATEQSSAETGRDSSCAFCNPDLTAPATSG